MRQASHSHWPVLHNIPATDFQRITGSARAIRLSVFICCTQPPRGRVLTETKTITGAGTFTTSYGYDAMDRVVTTTYPSGEVVTQTYNNASQLARVRSATYNLPYANNMAASRNVRGQVTQMTHGNNLTTTYTYAPLNSRLARIHAARRRVGSP